MNKNQNKQRNPRKEAVKQIRSLNYENASVQDLRKIYKTLKNELNLVSYYIQALK